MSLQSFLDKEAKPSSLTSQCDEILCIVGAQLEPKALCNAFEATRSQTQAFRDPQLLKESIVNVIIKKLSEEGSTHFANPILLGTKDSPSQHQPQSQEAFLIQKIEAFLQAQQYGVEALKTIYRGLTKNLDVIPRIMRGFFDKASQLSQQRTWGAIAALSVQYRALADFFAGMGQGQVNINARGEYNHTALEAALIAYAKSMDTTDMQKTDYLLKQGANTRYLSAKGHSLFEEFSQQNPTLAHRCR